MYDFFDFWGLLSTSCNENSKKIFWQGVERRSFRTVRWILKHWEERMGKLGKTQGDRWRQVIALQNCARRIFSRGSCPNQNSHYCLPVRFRLKHELFLYIQGQVFSSFASREELSESFGEQNEWFHFSNTTSTHKSFLSLVWRVTVL